MKPFKTRLTALLLAALMALGLMGAAAETAAPMPMPANPFAALIQSGQAFEMNFTIQMNPSLGNLLARITGQPMDAETQSLLTTLVSAVNRLNAQVIQSMNGVSGVLGTDKGSLLDFQVAANPETLENTITTNLLPGIALSLDPEALKTANANPQITPEKIMQLAQPYLAVYNGVMGNLNQNLAREQGSFEVEGYGSFTAKSPVALTTHMTADIMEQFLGVYRQDESLKKFVEEMGKTGQNLAEDAQSPEDLEKSLTEEIAKLREGEDKPVLTGEYYEGEGKSLISLLTAPSAESGTLKVDFFKEGGQGKIKLLMKSPAVNLGAPAATAEQPAPAAIDWAQAEKDILSGANFSDTLVTLNFSNKGENPLAGGKMDISLFSTGINAGIGIDHDLNPDTMEAKGAVTLTMMSPEPLLTIHFTAKPAAGLPAAPLADGSTPIVIKEGNLGEQEQTLLMASLQKALPELMERLFAALPEEAPTLMALLQSEDGADELPEPEPAPSTNP